MKINRDKFSASVLLLFAALFVGNWAWSAADYGNTAVLSPTDASNASGTMPSWSGSAAPSTIDDAGRAFQGAAAREWEARSFVTSTGTAPAFVVTQTVAPAAYRTGQSYCFTAHAAAVGTDTANFNSLGAKGIKKVVAGVKTATAANDFYTNDKVCTVYDGTDLVWTNRVGSQSSASTSAEGIVELLTTTEQLTGTDTTRAATADSVAALWEQGSDVASAGTISIGEGGYFNITGTTTITDIDLATDKSGRGAWVKFAGALTLTHNASTLILPSGANITTAAGDTAKIVSEGSDAVRIVSYNRASGAALVSGGSTLGTPTATTSGTTVDYTGIPATAKKITVLFRGVSWADTSDRLAVQLGDSGGIETTGYNSDGVLSATGASPSISNVSSAFVFSNAGTGMLVANAHSGALYLTLENSSTNTWIGTGMVLAEGVTTVYYSVGYKALSATLDRVRITTVTGQTFDAGEVNILYE